MKIYRNVWLVLIVFLVLMLLAGCGQKPEEIALELAEAVNTQDVDQALALFSEDALVTSVSPEPFRGKAQIQGWLEGMIADDFKLEPEIAEVSGNKVVEHDTMTMDSMSFFGIEPLTGTSELVVEDGKIQAINFSWSEETLADLQSAPFVASEDLIGTWYVGSFMEIRDDGTIRVADKQDDLSRPVSEENPGSQEERTYDGMVMTMRATEPGVGEGYTCTPDELGVYFVRWAGDDLENLKFEVLDDPCGARMGGMMWGQWKPVGQSAADETITVEAVVQGFIEAQNAGDVEGALSFLAEDAVVQLIPPPEPAGDGVFTGKEDIRVWYEILAEGQGTNELSNVRVNGDQVTALIRFSDGGLKQMGVDFLDNEWVATIKDGKIQGYTATVTEESATKLVAALEAAQEEPEPTPTPAIPLASSPEDVIGTWKWIAGEYYIRFDDDGTARLAYSQDELQGSPFVTMSYQFDGTKVVIKEISVSVVESCGSTVGNYEIPMLNNGNIQLVAVNDKCEGRAGEFSAEYEPLD